MTAHLPAFKPPVLPLLLCLAAVVLGAPVQAASPDGPGLVSALRQGGCVIVMRHPSSPFTLPDEAHADPGNTKLERQLDETGRKTAREMGEAFRKLHIPVGDVFSSPDASRGDRFGATREARSAADARAAERRRSEHAVQRGY